MLKRLVIVTTVTVLTGTAALAQKIEITPFVGYRFGGSIPVLSDIAEVDINKIKFDNSAAWGVAAGYNFTEHFGVEFMWNRQSTDATGELAGGGVFDEKVDVNLDQYLGNILYNFRGEDEKLRPFLLFGLGATRAVGAGSSATKFAFTVGGGVKYFFSDHFGVRAQARWAPTYLFTTSGGIWCNWWGYCWNIPNNHFMNQGEVSVGAVLRF